MVIELEKDQRGSVDRFNYVKKTDEREHMFDEFSMRVLSKELLKWILPTIVFIIF